jgi:iron complex outermembrane receptor protein
MYRPVRNLPATTILCTTNMQRPSGPLPERAAQPASVCSAVSRLLRSCRRFASVASAGGLLFGSLNVHAQSAAPAQAGDGDSPLTLESVVVTAQRRKQTVQDIPYNITAVDGGQIANAGASSLNDLVRVVPGLTTVDEGDSARGRTNNLTLRGLRTDSPGGGRGGAESPGSSVSSVSTYFGETPVFFPMPLYDLDHVEVLRGPQGTLYGSGAQAGTIRVVPKRPDFTSASGQIMLDGSISEHSNDPNSNFVAIGNLPLADNLAVRAIAGRQHDGGFINNDALWARQGSGATAVPTPSVPGDLTSGPVILPTQNDTNWADKWFARGAIRWAPRESLDFQLDYLHQHIYSNNSSYSNPGFPGSTFDMTTPVAGPVTPSNPSYYPHSAFVIPPGGTYVSTAFTLSPYEETLDLVSAVGTVDLGLATLTSATSFYTDRTTGTSDFTNVFDNPATFNYDPYPPYNFYPRLLSPQPQKVNDRSFVQELRIVSNGKNRFDYVGGLYFQRETGFIHEDQYVPGILEYLSSIGQPNPSPLGDVAYVYQRNNEFKDVAAFGELTFHATEKWQVTVGARAFHQTFHTDATGEFPLCGAECSSDGTNPSGLWGTTAVQSSSRVIKKVNTSYDITPDTKVYVTYSEGFRRGGANAAPTFGPWASLPSFQTFTPDLAKNYEVGIKGSTFDRRLRYSADVYRVDLDNFQFDSANLSFFPTTFNGKTARSQGVELEFEASLTRNTTMALGYGYTDAKVTQSFSIYDYPPFALLPGGSGQPESVFNGPIAAGTRLPGVPKNTLSASIDHGIAVGTYGKLNLHIDGAYRGAAGSDISTTSTAYWVIPSSIIGNFRAAFDAKNNIGYEFYVNNFTNNVGYTGGSYVQTFENYARFRNVSRPRTYGLKLRYSF